MADLESEQERYGVFVTPELFIAKAARYCKTGEFAIDEHNKEAVELVVKYANQDPTFETTNGYRLNRGLCIAGPKGTGKSVLLKTLNLLIRDKFALDNLVSLAGYYQQKDVGDTLFKQIAAIHREGGLKNHRFGNDLGRENKTAQYMGNYEDVGARYVYERYELFQDHRIITHFTTNFESAEEFTERYGDLTYDRISEMCNFIFLNGPSRRS